MVELAALAFALFLVALVVGVVVLLRSDTNTPDTFEQIVVRRRLRAMTRAVADVNAAFEAFSRSMAEQLPAFRRAFALLNEAMRR